jgi:eukaryotic-like serine/threonine-protein kinase
MNPALSPDGRRLAFSRSIDGNTDVWISDIDRGIPVPLTRTPLPDIVPIWSPDGQSIVFSSSGGTGFELRRKSIGDNLEPRSLVSAPVPGIAMHYSLDGQYVLYRPPAQNHQWDIWAASMDGGQPIQVVNSKSDDRTAQFSPDSQFIAYESNQTGQYEIYVRPFPAPGADKAVSAGGGSQPRVRRRGNSRDEYEVFYVAPDSYLMAATIALRARDEISIGTPQRLFAAPVRSTVYGGTSFEYDVTADGQRFLINTFVEQPATPISLILNRKPLRQ